MKMRQIDGRVKIFGQDAAAAFHGIDPLGADRLHFKQQSQRILRRQNFEKGLSHLSPDHKQNPAWKQI
jgi:hypothetical protein